MKNKNNKKLKQILFGILLGNGNLQTYTGGKTWRVRFIQSNKDYLFHLYEIFKIYVKTPPKLSFSYNKYSRWTFNTTVQSIWLEFSDMFYTKKYKKIMPNIIYLNKYLTPITIAYWFMDNGSLKSNCLSYYLCTDGYKLNELKLIGIIFKDKYDINISYHKKGLNYRIYISKKDYIKFRNIIEPYIHKSMYYKLPKN